MEAAARARQELHRLVDELPEAETYAARRYLEYLRDRRLPGLKELLEAPEEEEELTDAARKRLDERGQLRIPLKSNTSPGPFRTPVPGISNESERSDAGAVQSSSDDGGVVSTFTDLLSQMSAGRGLKPG
jgi:hypothetical protein